MGTCSFLAGVFLTADAERSGHPDLAASLRRRTLGVGLVTGAVVFVALVPISRDATLVALLVAVGLAMVLVLPALAHLVRLPSRNGGHRSEGR